VRPCCGSSRRGSPPTWKGPCRPRPAPATHARDSRAALLAYRDFVRANPNGYRLLFADLPADALLEPERLAALGAPLVAAVSGIAGEADALEAARTVVAWAHGFVTMELSGAFRLGGDLDVAYAFGIEAILEGVSRAATR
jgi:hypothetical protein